ncbi:flagellar transcriptional activator FlhC [Herbaspirillum rubrisubalbicans]|uniref:flagellar transcriptional regulator FlhC n=1 Tax=Herbaspirillum rubrisubalbicans TaxID=80842 RepID=UPI00036405F8|nr:flagellar transcriptional regulator FlhC [Herbaspirillum rubrisubalbicans]MCP1573347.1 flagellar transcriptional activator FlhC [Herbaspirillum rubrisubalbicans]
MAKKSVVTEAQEIQLAIELINLGARLQLLESETSLSRERLLKLYKELKGVSPPKGMLPFSTDWFITWQPNIHSSLFINIHRYLVEYARISGIEAVMKAYKLYLEQVGYTDSGEPVLSLTRAWTLVRFFESKMLMTTPCCKCGGHFVVHRLDLHQDYLCGLCHMPSRAGKTKKAKDAVVMGLVEAAMPLAVAAPLPEVPVLAAVA